MATIFNPSGVEGCNYFSKTITGLSSYKLQTKNYQPLTDI
jgi:hypothetical protein